MCCSLGSNYFGFLEQQTLMFWDLLIKRIYIYIYQLHLPADEGLTLTRLVSIRYPSAHM